MVTSIGNVVEVDMSKKHHLLVVQSKKHGMFNVSCVDCDESRDIAFKHLDSFVCWLEGQDDVQVLSWIDVDVSE